jgi:hypothetical protein
MLGRLRGNALEWSVLTVCALSGVALVLRALFR